MVYVAAVKYKQITYEGNYFLVQLLRKIYIEIKIIWDLVDDIPQNIILLKLKLGSCIIRNTI